MYSVHGRITRCNYACVNEQILRCTMVQFDLVMSANQNMNYIINDAKTESEGGPKRNRCMLINADDLSPFMSAIALVILTKKSANSEKDSFIKSITISKQRNLKFSVDQRNSKKIFY